VIDPRRKRQNEERARQLIALHNTAFSGAQRGEKQAVETLGAIYRGRRRNWGVPAPFDDATLTSLLPPNTAVAVGGVLVEQAIEPLRDAIEDHIVTHGPVLATVNEHIYTFAEPVPYEPNPRTWMAPLTSHVSPTLVRAVLDLHTVVFDPGRNAPLAIERAHYARERTKLIEVEHQLWELAAEYGAFSDRIPYAYRLLLLVAAWLPEAHRPPGAHTICLRCGDLLFRKRCLFKTLPNCPACMKETSAQREWPPHAMAPHARGTWLLRCQYPGCEMVVEGPRHRKLCDDHTSSKLPPKQRLKTIAG
jgi:hypothetical protein